MKTDAKAKAKAEEEENQNQSQNIKGLPKGDQPLAD